MPNASVLEAPPKYIAADVLAENAARNNIKSDDMRYCHPETLGIGHQERLGVEQIVVRP